MALYWNEAISFSISLAEERIRGRALGYYLGKLIQILAPQSILIIIGFCIQYISGKRVFSYKIYTEGLHAIILVAYLVISILIFVIFRERRDIPVDIAHAIGVDAVAVLWGPMTNYTQALWITFIPTIIATCITKK